MSRPGGSGCAIMGLASIGGHCPLCDLMQLREGVLILGPSLRCCCNTQNPLRMPVWLISAWQHVHRRSPHCCVVGATELLAGAFVSPLLRAIVSRSVDDSRQAEAISALFVVDTFCHSVSSYVTKTMYAHCVPKRCALCQLTDAGAGTRPRYTRRRCCPSSSPPRQSSAQLSSSVACPGASSTMASRDNITTTRAP